MKLLLSVLALLLVCSAIATGLPIDANTTAKAELPKKISLVGKPDFSVYCEFDGVQQDPDAFIDMVLYASDLDCPYKAVTADMDKNSFTLDCVTGGTNCIKVYKALKESYTKHELK